MQQRFFSKLHPLAFRKERKSVIFFFMFLCICSILILRVLGEGQVIAWVESKGARGPAMIVVIRICTSVFPVFTGTPGYIASGALFGLGQGFIYNFIGNAIGMTIGFFLARRYGEDILYKVMDNTSAKKMIKLAHRLDSPRSFAIVRSSLFFIDDVFNYAGGISAVRYIWFFAISMIVSSVTSLFMIQAGVVLMGI